MMTLTSFLQEATLGVVNLPEAHPDAVGIMLRHLYGAGTVASTDLKRSIELTTVQDIDVDHLKTPALCVRCWKLADYVQLHGLKSKAISCLNDHLDAMAWLASSDLDIREISPTPKWLGHFFDAFHEVCTDEATRPLQTVFITFLWVTRFHILELPQTWDILEQCPGANKELLRLLARHEVDNAIRWIPYDHNIEWDIHTRRVVKFENEIVCTRCDKEIKAGAEPRFYNPLPVDSSKIGQSMWCKHCVTLCNRERFWPWRRSGAWGIYKTAVKVEAWSWSIGE